MGKDMDKDLDPRQKATSEALRIMIEESLYWALVLDRYVHFPTYYFTPTNFAY